MLEHEIQCNLVKILDGMGVLYSASAGGMRTHIRTAMKMKSSGYKKGCPDLMIFEPRGKYKGLFIEVKTKKGSASDSQIEFIASLNDRGYRAEIRKGLDSCIELINDYFSVDDIK